MPKTKPTNKLPKTTNLVDKPQVDELDIRSALKFIQDKHNKLDIKQELEHIHTENLLKLRLYSFDNVRKIVQEAERSATKKAYEDIMRQISDMYKGNIHNIVVPNKIYEYCKSKLKEVEDGRIK